MGPMLLKKESASRADGRNEFLRVAKVAPLITYFGDPILREVSIPIPNEELSTSATQELAHQLISNLRKIRQLTGIGRALAAPQIGVSRRMIVLLYEDKYWVLINPAIVGASHQLGVYPELCLSGLPMAADVVRPWTVEITFQDLHGVPRTLGANPLLSRIVQHEIDHLDGTLFIDKADLRTIRFVCDFEEYKREAKLSPISK
jgi:peptide deformylase